MSDFNFMETGEKSNEGLVVALNQRMTKSHIKQISDEISLAVDMGEKDPLDLFIQAKGLEELGKMIQSNIKGNAIIEAENYGKMDSVRMGVGFLIKNIPNTFSFNHYDGWNMLNNNLTDIKAQMKELEATMIEAMKYGEIVTKDGEVIPAAVVKQFGGETLQVNIPK